MKGAKAYSSNAKLRRTYRRMGERRYSSVLATGSAHTTGFGKTGLVLTVGGVLWDGYSGVTAMLDVQARQNHVKILKNAIVDLNIGLENGLIDPNLQTIEGLSSVLNYILQGTVTVNSNNGRNNIEEMQFDLDVINTGNRIIDEISSQNPNYPDRNNQNNDSNSSGRWRVTDDH